ncbi:MAG: hypothetical protein ACUVUU_08325 [bacterium]
MLNLSRFLRKYSYRERLTPSKSKHLNLKLAYLTVLLLIIAHLGGCEQDKSAEDQTLKFTFCFEDGLEEWIPRGIDLDQPDVEWEISWTNEMAKCGNHSVKLHLNNLNDKAKIWIEREFKLKPNCGYEIELKFAFATADFGEINLWRMIAGASNKSPKTREDLIYRDDTGKDSNLPQHEWTTKTYLDTLTTSGEGSVYFMVGVWGTHEVERTYFVDSIEVTISPPTAKCR